MDEHFDTSANLANEFRVLTAVYNSRNNFGVATYFEDDNSIWVDSFPSSSTEMRNTVEFIKAVTKTRTFLLNPYIVSNKGLLDIIVGDDTTDDQVSYQTLKSSCWQITNAKTLISSTLRVRASYQDNIGVDIFFYLSQVCDIESDEIMQALGALVYSLSKDIFQLDRDKVMVSGIKPFPKDFLMRMDKNTFKSLQIFKEDFHPNWIRGRGKSKEGFSLFVLFDRTLTPPGKRKLHEWMSSPSYNLEAINSRHEDVSFFVHDDSRDIIHAISSRLKHTADIPHLMMNMKKACMKSGDWCKLHRSLKEWIAILDIFSGLNFNVQIVSQLMKTFLDDSRRDSVIMLSELVRNIDSILDIQKCEEENAIVVVKGYNEILDQKRDIFETIEHELIRAAQMVLDMTPVLENLSVEYIPQLGFHVVVDFENWNLLRINKCIDEASTKPTTASSQYRPVSRDGESTDIVNAFRFSFHRDDRYYLKHKVMDDMDETIGDIKSEILDLQKQCLLDIEEIIINQEVFIFYMSGCIATLDATMSLSLVARENKLIRPNMIDDNILVIKGGRHLLQELTVESFVPNDTFAGNDKNISIITGPNGSGKSIYLKQIGIITYLAHIGSFVPCERAIIGLTDQIFTRIASEESVSVAQSTFTIDLCQMAKMFRGASKSSLCLIDEFGKGTMPLDGIALLGAVLKHFSDLPCRTFCVLHLTEVLDKTVLPPELLSRINCFKMDTITENSHPQNNVQYDRQFGHDSDDDDNELIPLYKLKVGVVSDSEGIACAKTMGVNQKVIDRAKQIKSAIQSKSSISVRLKLRVMAEKDINFLRDLFETGTL